MTAVEKFWKEISEIMPCKVDSVTALKVYDKLKEAKEMEEEQEEQYNNMLSMLQETYRRLEHTDMISLRKQIKELLNPKSE